MTTPRLFLLQPAVNFAARVNMASVTYPLDEIVFDGVTTGAYANIFVGMTVLLGSAAGLDDYGRTRVREAASSTVLPVGRSSQGINDGELNVVDNAYITILNDFRVWAKIGYIDPDGDIFKDSDIAAGSNVLTVPPTANGGAGFAGTINPATGLITVNFDASASFQFDPAISSALTGITDCLWEVDDGTITAGSASDDLTITATFPAGFRWVHFTAVSDDSVLHQCHIPVFARDPDDDVTIAHQVTSHRLTTSGQELSVRILQDIDRSDYPDGTLVMLWDDDLQSASITRPHVLFVGWEQSNDAGVRAEQTGNLRDTTLHCVDVLGRLKTLPGFPQAMEAIADPDTWSQTRYPNILYYLWYLLHWHSTALDVADLLLGTQTLNNFHFKILGSDAANLFEQVESLASNVTPDHHFTCNRRGQMMLVVDPMLQYVPDRSSSVLDTIDDSDWTDIRFTYNRPPRVHQLRAYAVSGGDTSIIPLAALAPGDAPGQGEGYIESSERITFSQFDLNNNEGNRYARLNARYGRFTITLPYARLSINNDPAYMQWVRLTVGAANQTQRGLPFTNQRGLVSEISITYDYQRTGLVITAVLVWEMETSGPPAQTLELEAEEA